MDISPELKAFSDKFWEARRLKQRGDEAGAKAASDQAGELARHAGLAAEAALAEAAVLEMDGALDECVTELESLLQDSTVKLRGHALFVLGSVCWQRDRFAEAVEFYERALGEPTFDRPGYAWNNMGIGYSDLKDYAKAIDCYKKALDSLGLDTPGNAWNNMGNAYSGLKDHAKAIECYEKALDSPGYDRAGDAWNNMGYVHYRLNDHAKAIECWQKAVGAHRDAGDDEKVEHLERLIALATIPDEFRSAPDQAKLLSASAAAEAVDQARAPEARMQAKVERAEKDRYERYGGQKDSHLEYTFAVLRGWSSTVPLVETNADLCRGGGYFLKWRGKGLVIDPGHDFVRNFHEDGFHCREINVVVVSHNHGDHNQDLKPLDDIFYEMWKRNRDSLEYHYVLIWDKDSENHVGFETQQAVYRHCAALDLGRIALGMKDPIRLTEPEELPFEIRHFKAKHGEDVPNAVGLRITCLPESGEDGEAVTIGYTGDTAYHDDLCSEECLGGCDLLIAHISQPDPQEYTDREYLKKTHLGYRGLAKLISGCKPKLTVVGEFWAGLADLRIDLVQGLRDLCDTRDILPASLGLHIDPRTLEVRCTACKREVPWLNVQVAPPQEPFGPLSYLCTECRL